MKELRAKDIKDKCMAGKCGDGGGLLSICGLPTPMLGRIRAVMEVWVRDEDTGEPVMRG